MCSGRQLHLNYHKNRPSVSLFSPHTSAVGTGSVRSIAAMLSATAAAHAQTAWLVTTYLGTWSAHTHTPNTLTHVDTKGFGEWG